jgi:hypothetical protein
MNPRPPAWAENGTRARSARSAGGFHRKFQVETAAAAVMVGVPVHTIRNWAARGHLKPLRKDGTKTLYDADDVARVAASFGYLPDLREEQDTYCCAPHCKAVTWPDVPVPLCRKHAIAIWLHVNDEFTRAVHGGDGGWRDGEWDPALDPAGSQQPVVYFVRIGDLVKIGTTVSLPKRLTHFRAHTQDQPQVLLVLPGSYAEEKQLHALFRADRVRGEWFTLSPALTEFMAERQDQDIRNIHGPLVARD